MGLKVVRITRMEFELSDGRVIPHVEELEIVPTIEEFQQYLDRSKNVIEKITSEATSNNRRNR